MFVFLGWTKISEFMFSFFSGVWPTWQELDFIFRSGWLLGCHHWLNGGGSGWPSGELHIPRGKWGLGWNFSVVKTAGSSWTRLGVGYGWFQGEVMIKWNNLKENRELAGSWNWKILRTFCCTRPKMDKLIFESSPPNICRYPKSKCRNREHEMSFFLWWLFLGFPQSHWLFWKKTPRHLRS